MPSSSGTTDALVLLHLVVLVALQRADDRGEAVVQLGGVSDAPRDDQRRAGLVDEDRVDLVDDGVVVATLGLVDELAGHVVAQVVEPELVVRAVRDVGGVLRPLLGRRRLEAGNDQADLETKEAVDATHPLGVEPRQVVVDGNEVHALAADAVEVGRERRDQRLALAGLHLRHPPEVQRHATHQLHVEVALTDDPLSGLAHHRERLDGQVVKLRAVGETLAELGGLRQQCLVAEAPRLGLQRVDVGTMPCSALSFLPSRTPRRMRSRMPMGERAYPAAPDGLRAARPGAYSSGKALTQGMPVFSGCRPAHESP